MEEKLMKIICLLLISCGLWAGGSREDIREKTDYGQFRAISIRIPADVIIERDSQCKVEADIPSQDWKDIEILNDHGILIIRPFGGGIHFFKAKEVRFIITLPVLEEIHMSSAGRLRSNHTWEADAITIRTTSSAEIELDTLIAKQIQVETSSSGNITVQKVKGGSVEIHTSSSGDITVDEVKGDSVEIQTSSSGDIQIGETSCTDTVIKATSSGTVRSHLDTRKMVSSQSSSGDLILSGRAAIATIKTTGSGDFEGSNFLADESDIVITGSGDVSLMAGSLIKGIKITGSGSFSNY